VQRIFFSSGLSPDDFWKSTFDEVLLVIQGKVDEWRILRNNAYLIHCSMVEKRADILSVLPLPYDDELEAESELTDEEIYNQGKIIRIPGINYAK